MGVTCVKAEPGTSISVAKMFLFSGCPAVEGRSNTSCLSAKQTWDAFSSTPVESVYDFELLTPA